MNPELLNQVMNATPDLNSKICQGLPKEQLKGAERYINEVFEAAAKDFPEGLEYKGYRRVTPTEEFKVATHARDGKSTYELAKSDVYLVAYDFEYFGEKLHPRYMYLPFVDTGGILHVRGNKFAISPVLADPAVSISTDSMFIPLTRTRLTFERLIQHYMTNQERSRETTYVAWSWIHNTARQNLARKGKDPTKIICTTLVHYLFAKYGVTQTFSEFTGADVIVGDDKTVTTDEYPKDEWVICYTSGVKPRRIRMDVDYRATRLRIAVRKNQYTQSVQSLIGGFFYLADNMPNRISVEFIDDTSTWKILLGEIIQGPGVSHGAMLNEIDSHLTSLDEYIDSIVKKDLKSVGIEHDNVYELLMYVIETLSRKVGTSTVNISSMYNKRLITLRFVLYELVCQINNLMYRLQNAKKKRAELTIDEINSLMNMHLRMDKINTISNRKFHPEVNSVNTSNDNIYFSITSSILTQDSAIRNTGKKMKVNLRDPAKHLHVSIAEVASYCGMPKSDPTGRNRINPFVSIKENYDIDRHVDLVEVLDNAQCLISK